MPIKVTCPNKQCGAALKLKDEAAGKKFRCPSCGTPIRVHAKAPAEPPPSADESKQGEMPTGQFHPARQVCTNCGTVLGVRAKTCPGCGGDVRTGVTRMRITAEEKEKSGIFAAFAGMKKKRRRRRSAARPVIVVVVLLLLLGGAVFGGFWLKNNWQSLRAGHAEEPVEAAETDTP